MMMDSTIKFGTIKFKTMDEYFIYKRVTDKFLIDSDNDHTSIYDDKYLLEGKKTHFGQTYLKHKYICSISDKILLKKASVKPIFYIMLCDYIYIMKDTTNIRCH